MALKDCHNFWNYSRIYIQYNILDAPKWPYAQPWEEGNSFSQEEQFLDIFVS